MPDTETVDVFDFVTLISPESGNLNGAKGALKMAGMGFYIDLEKAKDAGLGASCGRSATTRRRARRDSSSRTTSR